MSQFLAQCGIDLLQLDITNQGIPDFVYAMITKYYSQYAGEYCTELAKQGDLQEQLEKTQKEKGISNQ